jgi:hypothetical protein
MASRVRRRFTYANVAMTLALVFAMSGGAYAAGKYLITSTKQIKPSVLKQLQGKAGPAGARGPQGALGAAGPQGPAGANGTAGAPGAPGTSVTSASLPAKNANCKEGGSEFKAGSTTTFACNGAQGKEGPPGPEGSSGGQFLPKGKTLRGAWSAYSYGEAEYPNPGYGAAGTAVSFALPLTGSPVTHYIGVGDGQGEGKEAEAITKGECTGNFAEPGAAEGNLCVFASSEVNLFSFGPTISLRGGVNPAIGTVGFQIAVVSGPEKGVVSMEGSWAVTG